VALAARYRTIVAVTAGTTLGMLASDGLAVFLGEKKSAGPAARPASGASRPSRS
jgi:putative Ca2+/H+ antiporter (TMEM165/GDT1 family)